MIAYSRSGMLRMSLLPYACSWVPALPALLCCTCLQLHHPGNLAVQELETPLQLPFLAESGDPLVTLRAAAIVKEHWVYMFNLDESPATCDIMSPFACSYKAKVSAEGVGTMKTLSVKHVAWSRKLGKDFLPKSLLNNRFYARSKIAVILKQDDKYFSCTPQLSRSGPMASLLPAVQQQLGLSFVPMEFVPDERPSSAQQQQASKRKKGGKRKASGEAS